MRFFRNLALVIGIIGFSPATPHSVAQEPIDEKLIKAEAETLFSQKSLEAISDFVRQNTHVELELNEVAWVDLSDEASQKKIVAPFMEKLSAEGEFKVTKVQTLFFSGTVADPIAVYGMKNVAVDMSKNGLALLLETDYAPKKNHSLKYVIYTDGTSTKIERRYYVYPEKPQNEDDEPAVVVKPLRDVIYTTPPPAPKKDSGQLPETSGS